MLEATFGTFRKGMPTRYRDWGASLVTPSSSLMTAYMGSMEHSGSAIG
jgi:hypothetical protein